MNSRRHRLVQRVRWFQLGLVITAVALPLTSQRVGDPLALPGTVSIFVSDLIVALAIAAWVVVRAVRGGPRSRPASLPALRWPLLFFAIALIPGIVRGYERYDAPLLGQPLRLVLYAGIALALIDLRPLDVYRGIVAAVYAGAAWQAVLAAYSLAVGTSQTDSWALSTGGMRVLALSAASTLSGAVVLALLNLEFDRNRRRRLLHVAVIGLASFGVIVAYGRTNFVALALVLPFFLARLLRQREKFGLRWRLGAPVALAGVLVGVLVSPLGPTLIDRVTANPLEDRSFRYRLHVYEAALSGMRSGRWDESSALDPAAQFLSNTGFEEDVNGWGVQGGTTAAVRSTDPSFGTRSLRILTDGSVVDEGVYSEPLRTTYGQTWLFSIWLRGASGGEEINVSIWEYGEDRAGVGQTNLPITLTRTATQYVVRSTAASLQTRYVRALVRTRDRPQAISVLADEASMRTLGRPQPVRGVPFLSSGGAVGSPGLDARGGGRGSGAGGNALTNPGFEAGDRGWEALGASLTTLSANNPAFGERALRLATHGNGAGEGIRSKPVPTKQGDAWSFLIWLRGSGSEEKIEVVIGEYDSQGQLTARTRAPATLSLWPTQYFISTSIRSSETRFVRALVTTREYGRSVSFLADAAALVSAKPSPPANELSDPAGAGSAGLQIDEPLLGLGFGRSFEFVLDGAVYGFDGDPHNSFLWILGGGGFLALASFALLVGVSLKDSIRRLRKSIGQERALVLWAIAMLIIFLVNTLTEPYLSDPTLLLTFWTIICLPGPIGRPPEKSTG